MIHQWYFNRRITRFADIPRDVYIDVVSGCNLRCRMCPVHVREKEPVYFSIDLYRKVIGELSGRRRHVTLESFGEPLLHHDVLEFVRLAKARGHSVTLVTNGVLMDEAIAAELVAAGTDDVVFSIDSIDQDVYEAIRVGATFEKVMGNVHGFLALSAGSRTTVTINCITSYDPGEMRRIRQYWRGKANLRFVPFHRWGGLLPGASWPRADHQGVAPGTRWPCSSLWDSMTISARGYLLNCAFDIANRDPRRSVASRTVNDVWLSEMPALREQHVRGRIEAAPCSGCSYWQCRPRHASILVESCRAVLPPGLINAIRNQTIVYKLRRLSSSTSGGWRRSSLSGGGHRP
jgi:pyruvate-formate lyase-activating enzyme